jgi:hypothetical protein
LNCTILDNNYKNRNHCSIKLGLLAIQESSLLLLNTLISSYHFQWCLHYHLRRLSNITVSKYTGRGYKMLRVNVLVFRKVGKHIRIQYSTLSQQFWKSSASTTLTFLNYCTCPWQLKSSMFKCLSKVTISEFKFKNLKIDLNIKLHHHWLHNSQMIHFNTPWEYHSENIKIINAQNADVK